MEIIYRDGYAPIDHDKDGEQSIERIPMSALLEPSNYYCQTCFNFPVQLATIEELKALMCERQASILPGLEQINGSAAVMTASTTAVDDAVGLTPTKSMFGAAQLLANATDRARQLGLISNSGDKTDPAWISVHISFLYEF